MDFRFPGAEISDPNLVVNIWKAMIDELNEDASNQDAILRAATPGQRAIYALMATDGEVNNGGFAQFFTNSTGSLIDEAIEGAWLTRAKEHEGVLRAAAAIFSAGEVPEDVDERNQAFDSLPEGKREGVLSEQDDRWYELDKQLELTLRAYVEANPDQFFAD